MITVVNKRNGRTPGAIYAGRPGPFGNPFKLAAERERLIAVEKFREWFFGESPDASDMRVLAMDLPPNAVLECWCVPKLCHAQVIADWVNEQRSGV